MRPLSGLDAAFLYLEIPRAPMHVAALNIFETGTNGPRLDFATVRAHVSNILSKLDLTNRSQLVLYAVRKKLVDVDPSEPLPLDSEND